MALGAAAGLIALTLYYDRRRIRIAHVALAAVFVVCIAVSSRVFRWE